MTEQDQISTTPEGTLVEPMSISDKFIGILSEPTATYRNIHEAGGKASDWIVPLIALIIIVLAGNLIRFSDPAFLDSIRQKQMEAIEKQVESGALTQAQADQAQEQMESFGGMMKIFSAVGVVIGVPIVFFLIVLVYWVLARFALKGAITYSLTLIVTGLTMYIGVIEQIVGIILGYATGDFFSTLSPALFMERNLDSSLFKFMNALNPISIWSSVVLSIGFHIVAGISKAKAFGLVFGLWLLYVIAASFISLPFAGM